LNAAIREARSLVRRVSDDLRKQRTPEQLRTTEKALDQAARQIALGSPVAEAVARTGGVERKATDPARLVPGARVRLKRLGTIAEVVAPPDRGRLRVMAGVMKLTVDVDDVDLELPAAAKKRAPAQKRLEPATPAVDGFVPVRCDSNTVNLRGTRVDEALDQVDAYLDSMLRQDEPVAFVLHGHGTGALKQAVRQHLASHRLVARSHPADPEDGGDAFTVAWLRC
jgi:DNA mismatch repair protein MutS2